VDRCKAIDIRTISFGTLFIRRHLTHIREAFSLTRPAPLAVVNAFGLLVCKLGGVEDSNVYPTRGQTILVRTECAQRCIFRGSHRLGEEPTYIIPRPFGGDTILGGCRQAGSWYRLKTIAPTVYEGASELTHRIATR
jgi:D-amino-acid oxidase